ncbi:HEPN domain-containing protein [Shewanella sp. Isolate8]|uniref:HEPN domain-containing protein n=1 Tax=Shewanella sp. Isolate8 TaxID=2908529 RepID=UPI001EFD331C|nr:hypothetical protein [Shewanella sp. Isolate8]
MKDDRLRCPVDTDYVTALGLAAYTFARLEWQVVWCMEKIIPQSIHKVVGNELTAGQIAKKFIDATRNMPKSSEREQLKLLSKQFSDLVELRNRIVHGKPCTSPNKQQRLSSNGIIELIDLENAADDFSECANKLNSLFYGFLSE